MRISVIIPIKNRAHLLPETIESILRQTLLPAEIILVDDHSTDNLKEVIEPYGKYILYVKNKGKGPGAARNTGLEHATGEAIQFFDSDDIMSSNKLEIQAALLQAGSRIVIGPYIPVMKGHEGWLPTDVLMQYQPLPAKQRLADRVALGWCSITQACLFSKELIDKAGRWREDLMTHEDKEYWFRIALLEPFPAYENKSITLYRQHEQQITDKMTAGLERTENGIKAFSDILSQSKGNISFLSTAVLKGIMVNYKKYSIQHGRQYDIGITEHIYGFIAKAYAKIGRLRTGTAWQPMHGVNADTQIFYQYSKVIKTH